MQSVFDMLVYTRTIVLLRRIDVLLLQNCSLQNFILFQLILRLILLRVILLHFTKNARTD